MTLTLALLTLHTPECPSGAVLSIGSGAGLTCARRSTTDAVRSFDYGTRAAGAVAVDESGCGVVAATSAAAADAAASHETVQRRPDGALRRLDAIRMR